MSMALVGSMAFEAQLKKKGQPSRAERDDVTCAA